MGLSRRVLISAQALAQRVRALGDAITRDTPAGQPLSVLTVMDGAFLFCADLVRHLPMATHLSFVSVVSASRGGDPSRLALPDGFPVRGSDLLVVEDIVDTGRTLAGIRAGLAPLGARRIRTVALLDKPVRRQVAVDPDYVGFRVDDHWVVGYGLDFEGRYRNLPYVTFVEPM